MREYLSEAENVLRLDVAVYQPRGVAMLETTQDLRQIEPALALRELSGGCDLIEEVTVLRAHNSC